jgi:outer membrane receptor protein involved in Fe transport
VKGRLFDKTLTLAAAGFYYDYNNQQLQDTRPGPVSFLVNAPKSKIYGVETEATWHVVPDFTLRGSFGYLHATYSQLFLQNTNLAGNKLPFAPTWTAQAGFDWIFAHVGGGAVALSPQINYVSQQYFSPFNDVNAVGSAQENSELSQAAFTKVDVSLAWTREHWLVRTWSNNLFNKAVYEYGLDLRGAGFPYNFLVPSTPRTFGVSARYSF